MSCNCKEPLDCCASCGEAIPKPVMPRCDIALDDGRFTNATVVVENGCITEIEKGKPPQYTPDICCDGPTNVVVQSDPCDCPKGDKGDNATISIGTVSFAAPDKPPSVINSGTETNAILDFYLPKGEQGKTGLSPNGVNDDGAIEIENGVIKSLPATWPPVLMTEIVMQPPSATATIEATTEDGKQKITINLNPIINEIKQDYNAKIDSLRSDWQASLTSLQQRLDALEAKQNNTRPF